MNMNATRLNDLPSRPLTRVPSPIVLDSRLILHEQLSGRKDLELLGGGRRTIRPLPS